MNTKCLLNFYYLFCLFTFNFCYSQYGYIPNYKDPNPLELIYSLNEPKNLKNLKKVIYITPYGDTLKKFLYHKNQKLDEFYNYSSNEIENRTKYFYSKNNFDTIKFISYNNKNKIRNSGVSYYDKKGNLEKFESIYPISGTETTYFFYDNNNYLIRKSYTPKIPEPIQFKYINNKPLSVNIDNYIKINFKYNTDFQLEERIDSLGLFQNYFKNFEYKNNQISKIYKKSLNIEIKNLFEYENNILTKIIYYQKNSEDFKECKEECILTYNDKGNPSSIFVKLKKDSQFSYIFYLLKGFYPKAENCRVDFIYDNSNNLIERRYFDLDNPNEYKFEKYVYEYY